jgi:hypothetical protein
MSVEFEQSGIVNNVHYHIITIYTLKKPKWCVCGGGGMSVRCIVYHLTG